MQKGQSDKLRDFLQVQDELFELSASCRFIGCPQDRRRMDGCRDKRRQRRLDKFSAMLGDAKLRSEQSLRRGRSQADDDPRFDDGDFRVEPGTASSYFAGIGFFVNAPLAARFPLKMLYDIRDVNFCTVDARFFQSAIEQLAGGADKR